MIFPPLPTEPWPGREETKEGKARKGMDDCGLISGIFDVEWSNQLAEAFRFYSAGRAFSRKA